MKKTIKSLLALAVAAFAFTACSDVPEPEGYNSRQGDGLIDYTPEGVGTAASPYNVAGVLQATKDLAKGAKTGEIYTKGFVSKKEFSSQYGSFNYYITDNKEGKSKAFYVYSGIGLNKEKFTSENDLNVGDAVTICGTIVNFNGTIEYEKQNYLVELNGKTAGGGGGGAGTGSGTETDPYDVAAVIGSGDKTGVFVKGFIVGSAYSNQETKQTEWNFGTTNAQASNILVAASADEKDATKCIPVALPSGSAVRTGLNLKDNPGNLGKEVILYGNTTKYFGQQGVKETSYAKIGATEYGNKPGETPGPDEGTPITAGQYFFIYTAAGTAQVGLPVASGSDYGYITLGAAKLTPDNKLDNDAPNLFTFTAVEGGFTIQDASGRYYYMDATHKSFQVSATLPTSNHIWTAVIKSDGNASITNVGRGVKIQYSTQYKNFSPTDVAGDLPMLLKPGDVVNVSGGGESGGGESGGGASTVGTYDNPYTIAGGIEAQGAEFKNIKNIYVKGYIVGWIEGQVLADGAHFNSEATVKSNILIADKADETDISKCMPVQLPNNAVRTGLNLQDNPSYYKKAVVLYGELAKYFGAAGVKTVTYAESEGNSFGTKP